MNLPAAITALIARKSLSSEAMTEVMRAIMTGQATPAQIGGFLVALRMKGETVEEITAAARVMRELATPVTPQQRDHLVDTCGTGGDGSQTFNISTASAFVAAAAGCRVAKHGNRSVSGKSGSADVLEAAGVRLDLTAEQVARAIDEIGVGFLFAPAHHAAMKHAIGPRREMGVRTVFNLLGPLTNPAGAPNQVLGVFAPEWLVPIAEVLARLGSHHVLVVHADDGLDEISLAAPTQIAELRDGAVHRYVITPEKYGFARADLSALKVENAQASLAKVREALDDKPGPARDIVAMNAGAAIFVSGVADTLEDGMARAKQALATGAARDKLEALVRFGHAVSA